MICAACRLDNPAGNRFCGGCGVALAATCAACGQAHRPDHRFCGACGAKRKARTTCDEIGAPLQAARIARGLAS